MPLTMFANMVGVPYRSMQNYVRGEREPSAAALTALAKNAGVNITWLLTGQGPRFQSDALEKAITDKVLIVLIGEVLERCVKSASSPLSDGEKARLLTYLMSHRTLGLADAVRALFDVHTMGHLKRQPEWTDALTDFIVTAARRGRLKG